ncbi:hypothetical protein [Alistipes megaguti]|uniref:hypothetical protein n=1 Tax=Alistipes megaguti TaxID=2364787 RepID=UPI002354DBA7|nr:hypothetical protein [Alistipes megaguti]
MVGRGRGAVTTLLLRFMCSVQWSTTIVDEPKMKSTLPSTWQSRRGFPQGVFPGTSHGVGRVLRGLAGRRMRRQRSWPQ